jgi:hypothetical protein
MLDIRFICHDVDADENGSILHACRTRPVCEITIHARSDSPEVFSKFGWQRRELPLVERTHRSLLQLSIVDESGVIISLPLLFAFSHVNE